MTGSATSTVPVYTIKAGAVVTALSNQLSGAVNIPLQIRFKVVRLWGGPLFTGGENPSSFVFPSNSWNMDVYSLDQGATTITNQPVIASLNDSLGFKEWASSGFRWPEAQQAITFNASSTDQKVVDVYPNAPAIAASSGWPFMVRFELYWRLVPAAASRRFAQSSPTGCDFMPRSTNVGGDDDEQGGLGVEIRGRTITL